MPTLKNRNRCIDIEIHIYIYKYITYNIFIQIDRKTERKIDKQNDRWINRKIEIDRNRQR